MGFYSRSDEKKQSVFVPTGVAIKIGLRDRLLQLS